jgi:hypothetical protein
MPMDFNKVKVNLIESKPLADLETQPGETIP